MGEMHGREGEERSDRAYGPWKRVSELGPGSWMGDFGPWSRARELAVQATVPDDHLRIGDAERDAAVADLHEHFALGRLGTEELDQRLETALSAKTFGELRAITDDLPANAPEADRLGRLGRRDRPGAAGPAGRGEWRRRRHHSGPPFRAAHPGHPGHPGHSGRSGHPFHHGHPGRGFFLFAPIAALALGVLGVIHLPLLLTVWLGAAVLFGFTRRAVHFRLHRMR